MSDLESRLARLGTPAPDATTSGTGPGEVAADLARGRRALRTRRTRRAGVVSLGGLAALGLAAAVAVGSGTPSEAPTAAPSTAPSGPASGTGSSIPPATSSGTPSTAGADLRLVTYRGPQVPGFSVASVPNGFVLQGADNVSLAVARPGDRTGIFDFRDKIVVTVTPVDVSGGLDPDLTQVDVQGLPGTVSTSRDGTITVDYQLDADRIAVVQAWRDLGVSEQQVVEFARGLTISDDVETVG